jgi:amino acid adenylation domain-containing protein
MLNTSVHSIFSKCANENQRKVALSIGTKNYTYLELDQLSNQLARYIFEHHKNSKSELIGILSGPSEWVFITILAILKSDLAYIPLSVKMPSDRLNYILNDGKVSLVFGQKEHLDTKILNHDVEAFEHIEQKIAGYSKECLISKARSNDLAYVMYTSGTTGTPVGVEIPHRAILRLVTNSSYFPFHLRHTFLQLAPTSFDASTFEIWGALLNGHELVIYPHSILDFIDLRKCIQHKKISCLWLTNALFNLIVDQAPETLALLKIILTGGEALSVHHIKAFQSKFPRIQLINGYGPTENTTFTCCYSIPLISKENFSSIPIGKPVHGTDVYILNPDLTQTPKGEVGELYIGGEGLALRYRNQTALTIDRFIVNPIANGKSALLYKSGDFCKMGNSGLIEFLGRKDQQIKLRGFRIELGEIERVVSNLETVSQCVVYLKKNLDGSKLIAYFSRNKSSNINLESTINEKQLKAEIKKWLPDYMVPSIFIELLKFPINENGKIDRKRITQHEGSYGLIDSENVQNPESYILKYWKILFEIEKIDIHSNFFELGGDSLQAIRMLFKINNQFLLNVTLQTFYRNPTIENIIGNLHPQNKLASQGNQLIEIDRSTFDDFPLTPSQKQLWVFNELFDHHPAYNLTFKNSIQGKLDIPHLEKALNLFVKKHEALRTSFGIKKNKLVQEVVPYNPFDLDVYDIANLSEIQFQNKIESEAKKDIELNKGNLIRFQLYKKGENHFELLMYVHHIAFDGWSVGVFNKEIRKNYISLKQNLSLSNQTLAPQMLEYSLWLNHKIKAGSFSGGIKFWKDRIGINPIATELRTDYPRDVMHSFEGKWIYSAIEGNLYSTIKLFSKKNKVTLYQFLLSCFNILLYRNTHQDNILIGSLTHNRFTKELEDKVGFFVNNTPLFTSLKENLTFIEFLHQIKTELNDSISYRDVPFDMLIEELAHKRIPGKSPLFQILFILQNTCSDSFTLEGLKTSQVEVSNNTSKYDLSLIAEESTESINLKIEYNSNLYKEETIHRLLKDYITIVENAITNTNVKLSVRQIPKYVTKDNKFQLNANEKIVRSRIPNLDFREPKKPIELPSIVLANEQSMLAIWQSILGIIDIGRKDNFFELGGHSILGLELISSVNKMFNCQLSAGSIFKNPTIELLTKAVGIESNGSKIEIVKLKSGIGQPIFLAPGNRGNAFVFMHFAKSFKADNPLYAFDYSNLEGQELKISNMSELAQHCIEAIYPIQTNGPFHLVGYSFGGRLVFEIASLLQKYNHKVGMLTVLDTLGIKPKVFLNNQLNRYYEDFLVFKRLSIASKNLYIWKRLRQGLKNHLTKNGRNPNFDKNANSPFKETRRMLFNFWHQHQNSNKLDGDIFLIKQDGSQHPEYSKYYWLYKVYNTLFWESNILGQIKIKTFPCSHTDLLEPSHADGVTEAIHNYMNSHSDGLNILYDYYPFLKGQSESGSVSKTKVYLFNTRHVKNVNQMFDCFLDGDEQKRCNKYQNEEAKNNYIIRHSLLRLLISNLVSIEPKEIKFVNNSNGKPIFKENQVDSNIRFSISKSHHWIAIAISNDQEVGVDIEKISSRMNHLEIAQQHFHPDEIYRLENASLEQQSIIFTEIWTLKESLIKLKGVFNLNEVNTGESNKTNRIGSSFKSVLVDNNFILSVAQKNVENIEFIKPDNLRCENLDYYLEPLTLKHA